MNWLNHLLDSYNVPILTAFLLGIMTSISPCPLATNITAIAFISKDIKRSKTVLLNGLYYTFGRALSYTILAAVIYYGASSFDIAKIFKGFGNYFLGPLMILIGLSMFDIINPPTGGNKSIANIQKKLSQKGYLGSFLLGILFSIGFCPYSGIMFFAVLIPLILKSNEGIVLAPFFALGTSLPVLLFSFLLAFSAKKVGLVFNKIQKAEKIIRKIIAAIFIIAGLYYLNKLV
jgi:cytochrome c biogenesis protein CcdA